MNPARLFAWLVLCAALCAQAQQTPANEQLAGVKAIGVVSMAADYARMGFIGKTVFSNEHHYGPLDDWKLDEQIEADLLKQQDLLPPLKALVYDRALLFRAYEARDLHGPLADRPRVLKLNLPLIHDELAKVAQTGGVDLLLLVVKGVCGDSIGRTNQPLNGFGIYFGPRAVSSPWRGPGSWPSGVTAYLCADMLLFDPRKAEVLASRIVTHQGTWVQGFLSATGPMPQNPVDFFPTDLKQMSEEHKRQIAATFSLFASYVAPSVRKFLGSSN